MEQLAATSAATNLILKINSAIVNPLIIAMFAFALVGFLWGVRGYVSNSDDTEARQKGANHIMWGLIGMGIMVLAFTIEKAVIQTFGITNDEKTRKAIEKVIDFPG